MASATPRGKIVPIKVSSAGLTTATTSYTSGDVLGSQMQFRVGDGFGDAQGCVTELVVIDKAGVIGNVELWLFSSAVTPAADNAAVSFSDAHMQDLVAILPCSTAYVNAANKTVMMVPTEERPVFTAAGGILYGSLVTRSGHTFFGAVTDLTVIMHYKAKF